MKQAILNQTCGFIFMFALWISTANAQTYTVIATGQVTAYDTSDVITGISEGDAFYGQDAHYLKGAEMSYQDNGDGTITDLNTGLMWQQVPSSSDYTWQEAVDYCESLELNGYDDWRMPS